MDEREEFDGSETFLNPAREFLASAVAETDVRMTPQAALEEMGISCEGVG